MVAAPNAEQSQADNPPRGKTEKIEQQISHPSADITAPVEHRRVTTALRPTRVPFVVGEEDERDIGAQQKRGNPPGFAKESRKFRRQRFFRLGIGGGLDSKHVRIVKEL